MDMFKSIMSRGSVFLRGLADTITSGDGKTVDQLLVVGMVFFIVFFVLACWSVIALKTPLDYMAFGGGFAAAIGALGWTTKKRNGDAEQTEDSDKS